MISSSRSARISVEMEGKLSQIPLTVMMEIR